MARLEGFKQFHDSLKHLTTLNTAAIGLVVIFIEKLFPAPQWKPLVLVSLRLLVVSLFFSVSAMLFQAIETIQKEAAEAEYRNDSWDRIGNFMGLSYYSFFGAVLLLGVFFSKNYF